MTNVMQLRTVPVSIVSDETGTVTKTSVVYTLQDGQVHILKGVDGVANELLVGLAMKGLAQQSQATGGWFVVFLAYSLLLWYL